MAEINPFVQFPVIRDTFLGGVYNETYQTLFDGGEACASESSPGYKMVINLILVISSLLNLIFYSCPIIYLLFIKELNMSIKILRRTSRS